jgi:hypothetical protein
VIYEALFVTRASIAKFDFQQDMEGSGSAKVLIIHDFRYDPPFTADPLGRDYLPAGSGSRRGGRAVGRFLLLAKSAFPPSMAVNAPVLTKTSGTILNCL